MGDKDPLDLVELGNRRFKCGHITPVKVLASICLIDQGEVDWKIFAINMEEANQYNI